MGWGTRENWSVAGEGRTGSVSGPPQSEAGGREVGGARSTVEAGYCRRREGALLSLGLLQRQGGVSAGRRQTPDQLRDRQRGLSRKAKREPRVRFSLLKDTVWREDILPHAYRSGRATGGAPGLDGGTVQSLERGEGAAQVRAKRQPALQEKTYRAQPGRRVLMPKAEGKTRPGGMPPSRDRGAPRAVQLGREPSLEADCAEGSCGFRPPRDAHPAVGAIGEGLSPAPP